MRKISLLKTLRAMNFLIKLCGERKRNTCNTLESQSVVQPKQIPITFKKNTTKYELPTSACDLVICGSLAIKPPQAASVEHMPAIPIIIHKDR